MAGPAQAVLRILSGLRLRGAERSFRRRLLVVCIPPESISAEDLIDPNDDMIAVHALASAKLEGLKSCHCTMMTLLEGGAVS